MRKKRHMQKAVLRVLARELGPFGFQTRRDQTFYQSTEFGFIAFYIHFINHADDFDMTAHVALRYDLIESLVNQIDAELEEQEKRETCTLGGELGNLSSEGRNHRWTIANEEDIEPVCHSIVEYFKKVALPYSERFSDPENALTVLASDDPALTIHCPFHDARALRAVALTQILKGKEAAAEMAKKKLVFLESRKWKEDTEPLRALIRHLELRL